MSLRTKALASVAILGVLVAAIAGIVQSSFTATAKNEGNTFQTGSVSLTDDDRAEVLWDLDALQPSSTIEPKCITVTYGSTGDLSSTVRLHGTTRGALAEHLDVEITRGSFSATKPAGNACTGFTADAGGGVLFDDTLAAFPDGWTGGIVDPDGDWRAGDSAVYRIAVALADTDDAQSEQASQAFTFEARTR